MTKERVLNFNTFLLAVVLAVMSWVGYETVQTGKDISVMKALKELEVEQIKEIRTSIKALEARVGDTVTRSEFQLRLSSMEARLAQIERKVTP